MADKLLPCICGGTGITVVSDPPEEDRESWERAGLRALKSIYGMDIQADNVEEAKGRLFDMYIKQYPKSPAVSGLIAAQILENNIVCGDFIKDQMINKKRRRK